MLCRTSITVPVVFPYNFQTAHDAVAGGRTGQGAVMDWARILAYVTGTVDQELLGRNKYLAAERYRTPR